MMNLGLVLLLTITLSGAELWAQDHDDSNWVSTWSTSPSTIVDSATDAASVEDQTLRLIVHTSVGGSSLRLRLSNTHGDQAMKIGEVSVALQAEGSSIQAGSSKSLSFGGQSGIIIPRGATVISDAIEFTVPELSNLAVSLYLPESSGFLTAHALSNQTNYISEPGNHVASTILPTASESPAWNLLTAIDVTNSDSVTAIAMVGDSITDGWGSTDSANQRWPNHFARRLFADSGTEKFAVLNAGISGNQVTTEGNTLFGQNLQARFERDVLALTGVTHMVLMEGINDIGMASRENGTPTSAAQIIAGYRQLITRAHARSIKIIGATLTPFEGAAYFTPAGELVRQEVNEFIRNGGEFDGLIDFEKAVQDPANPARILPSLTEDNLHPNDIGYKLMADSIDLNLFR
jgi:lysophospholipase L1-like esterase